MFNQWLWSMMLLFFSVQAMGSGSYIGNGDDGIDLENTKKVESGILIETRKKAVQLLKEFDVNKVENLSSLIPEVEKTEIYLVSRDYKKESSSSQQEVSKEGMVYARTMPKLHAATRFFPQSLMLSEQELISLHIHEGLHRALPEDIREDESVVGEITLAITSPGASLDGLKKVVAKHTVPQSTSSGYARGRIRSQRAQQPDLIVKPSKLEYKYKGFIVDEENELYPLRDMHSVEAQFFPFIRKKNAFGFGAGFSFFQFEEDNAVGPVKLSAHWKVVTTRNYNLDVFAEAASVALSDEELKKYTFFRDYYTVGAKLGYSKPGFYSSVLLKVMESADKEETLGTITYTHEYPTVGSTQLRAGIRMGAFRIGGLFDFSLASAYKVSGQDFNFESGRSRIISGGPEITLDYAGLRFGLEGRYIIDATDDVTFDQLGDTFGAGAGRGFIASRIGYAF